MKNQLTSKDYKINFWAFVWHATLLAFSKSFIDTDTVLPALIIKAGGNDILIGLMSAIMVGSAKFMQLFFAPYISAAKSKRFHLLLAINIRIIMIFALVGLILTFNQLPKELFFILLFLVITIFSWSGSYGGVAYTDLLGKSIVKHQRITLFSLKQMFQAIGFVASAVIVKIILKRFQFPINYAYSFAIAGILLTLGSLGFWLLRELYVQPKQRRTIWQFFKQIPKEIRQNPNLKYFLLIVNLLGIFLAFSPYLISYAKSKGFLSASFVGNLLIIKMAGVVLGSLSVYLLKKYVRYRMLLLITAIITVILPISAVWAAMGQLTFILMFFLIGVGFSLLRIANEGILIEISNEQNRSEYAGIVGAANLSGIIFPLLLGGVITTWGYKTMFYLTALIGLMSIAFILKLNCR